MFKPYRGGFSIERAGPRARVPRLGLLALLLVPTALSAGTPGEDMLTDSGGTGGDLFGNAVSMDETGDVLAVGAWQDSFVGSANEGSARVFRFDGTGWNASPKLRSSTGASGDFFGCSLSLSGDVLVVGAYRDDVGGEVDQGSATVFRWDGAAWNEEQELTSSLGDQGDEFGSAVAVDGDVIAVGAPQYQFRGAVTLFRWDGATWVEEGHLFGFDNQDAFGASVALSGDVLAVGHPLDDPLGMKDAGTVRMFRWNGVSWAPEQVLHALQSEAFAEFGTAVALDGDVLLAGAIKAGVKDKGRVFEYRWDGADWVGGQTLMSSDPSFGVNSDAFGGSIDLAGSLAAVGAPLRDGFDNGAATVFRWNGSNWIEAQHLTLAVIGNGDVFGSSVAVGNDRVAVGAPGLPGPGTGFPQDEQGAVVVYDLSPGPWTNLGGGTVGLAGVPQLCGSGSLLGGSPTSLSLSDAPPGAQLVAWVSFGPTPFGALGGTVHAFPFARQVFLTADGSGALDLMATWPVALPPGTEAWFQFIVEDASVPPGLTLTDAWLASPP